MSTEEINQRLFGYACPMSDDPGLDCSCGISDHQQIIHVPCHRHRRCNGEERIASAHRVAHQIGQSFLVEKITILVSSCTAIALSHNELLAAPMCEFVYHVLDVPMLVGGGKPGFRLVDHGVVC